MPVVYCLVCSADVRNFHFEGAVFHGFWGRFVSGFHGRSLLVLGEKLKQFADIVYRF